MYTRYSNNTVYADIPESVFKFLFLLEHISVLKLNNQDDLILDKNHCALKQNPYFV